MSVDARELRGPSELLRESASLAWRNAPVLCRSHGGVRPDCAWYHGLWQYLRLLDIAVPPQRHAAFFTDALRSALEADRAQRIVITGTADYGMLAQVLASVGVLSGPGQVTAVDVCETPLFLCKWYAMRSGQALVTRATDVLSWATNDVYDIACTHSLIPQFPPAQRKELIAAWRRVLRPGGRVLTTARINPAWTPDRAGFAREQVGAFRALVVERAQALVPRLDIAIEELAAAAETFAERIVTHSLTSRDELVNLFESGGFRLHRLDIRAIGGSLDSGLAGPSTNKSGTYAEIVAIRE